MSANSLPSDLLPIIIELAAVRGDNIWGLDNVALARLCLVSKTFLSVARRLLYGRVLLSFMGAEPWLWGRDQDDYGGLGPPVNGAYEDGLGHRLSALRHADLAPLVKALRVDMDGCNEEVEPYKPPSIAIVSMLLHCPNLQSLRIEARVNEEVVEAVVQVLNLLQLGSTLTSLHLTFAGPSVLALLSRLPKLEKLTLLAEIEPGMTADQDESWLRGLPSFPFALQHYHANLSSPNSPTRS